MLRWPVHHAKPEGYERERIRVRGISRREALRAGVAALIVSTATPSLAMLLAHGGNQTNLPPPPPGPPFVPPALPTQGITLTWTGGGNPFGTTGVAEGGASSWTATSVARPGVNGHSYATLNDFYVAAIPLGQFTATIPQGQFQVGTGTGKGIYMNYPGGTCAFIGSGTLGTVLKPNRLVDQPVAWIDDPTYSSTVSFWNIRTGPFDAEIVANNAVRAGGVGGSGHFFVTRCGITSFNNMLIARSKANGISSSTQYEWQMMESSILLVFDSEIYGCGVNADQHNMYLHCFNLSRCLRVNMHSSGGHAWKVDGGRAEILDSSISGHLTGPATWGAINPIISTTYNTDVYMRGNACLSSINATVGTAMINSVRRETGSTISLKVPPYFAKQTAPGLSREITWVYGGTNGSQDSAASTVNGSISAINVTAGGTGYVTPPTVVITNTTNPPGVGVGAKATASISGGAVTSVTMTDTGSAYATGRLVISFTGGGGTGAAADVTVNNGALSGTSILVLQQVGSKITSTRFRNLSDTTASALDLSISLDDGTLQTTTGTITAHAAGSLTVQLGAPLNANCGVAAPKRPIVLKYNANALSGAQNTDLPVMTAPQRDLFDPTSLTYYWDIVAPGGVLSFEAQAGAIWGIPMHYAEDCLFGLISSSKTSLQPITLFRDFYTGYFNSPSAIENFPFGPLPSTDASWPTPTGAGNFNGALHAGGPPILGVNGSGYSGLGGSAFVRNNMLVACNIGINDLAVPALNRYSGQFNTNQRDGSAAPYSAATPITAYWLKSDGTLQPVTDNQANTSPMPTSVKFSTAVDALIGDSSVTIGAATGAVVIGQRLLITNPIGKGVHRTNVTGVSGSIVSFSDPLVYDIPSGSTAASFTAAGNKPVGWQNPEDFT